MAKTKTEIATSVLKKIGRLPDGQVAPASQVKTVTDAYEELYEELLNDSLVEWSAGDDIPDYAANPIKIMLLSRVADDFGIQNQWLLLEDRQRLKLGTQIATPYEHRPIRFEDI